MKRTNRLLLISYHFGSSASTGGFRWAAMLPYLTAAGWEASVLTATPHAPESVQSWAAAGITISPVPPAVWPEQIGSAALRAFHSLRAGPRVSEPSQSRDWNRATADELRTAVEAIPILTPESALGLRSSAGHSFQEGILAASHGHWSLRAARVAEKVLKTERHHVVLVSTPPHETQWAGAMIARKAKLPLAIDLRDPWVLGVPELQGYFPRGVRSLGSRIEVSLQRQADLVIHNTQFARERAHALTPPLPKTRRVVIPNGYDDAPPRIGIDPATFRILYCGWIYPFMDPRPLLRATADLVAHHDLSPERLRIQFVGSPDHLGEVPMDAVLRSYGLGGHAEILPRVERARALEMQATAALLVAFDYPHPLSVVMKAYDYLQMPGTILFLANPNSSLGRLGAQVGARTVRPGDDAGIRSVLEEAYQRWRSGAPPAPHDPTGAFHRSRPAESALQLLDELAERG